MSNVLLVADREIHAEKVADQLIEQGPDAISALINALGLRLRDHEKSEIYKDLISAYLVKPGVDLVVDLAG